MIIFDLACLADDSHRRHFIDPEYRARCGYCFSCEDKKYLCKDCEDFYKDWKPDYPSYYDACIEDKFVAAVFEIYREYFLRGYDIFIWSERVDSNREKTILWMKENGLSRRGFKIRSVGDIRPQEELFNSWLLEYYHSLYPKLDKDAIEGTSYHREEEIDFVFSSHKPTIDMFRRKGIFVFDCNQEIE